MYIHNGVKTTKVLESEWHHDGFFRLVEFSSPTNLSESCANSAYTTVRIQKTFLQQLATALTLTLYDPWEVSYACVRYATDEAPIQKKTQIQNKPVKKTK
jgi:hypothetical protein